MKTSKKNTNDNVFKILILIFIIITVIFIVLFFKYKNNMSSDNKIVEEIHNYFNIEDLNNCGGLFNYSDKKVSSEDISDDIKLCVAYQKSDFELEKVKAIQKDKGKETCTSEEMTFRVTEGSKECEISKVKKDIINDEYTKIFGGKPADITSFNSDNTHICYPVDDYYYCGLSETYTIVLEPETNIYRSINRAVEKGEEITIYDYFIRISNNNCYKNYTTLDINSECNNRIKNKNKIEYKHLKRYGTKYKHTYKKSDNNSYYWISSEPIN